jgi:hypothetical protein
MTAGQHIIAGVWAGGIATGLLYAIFVMPHKQTPEQWQRICALESFHPDVTQRERETCRMLRGRKM